LLEDCLVTSPNRYVRMAPLNLRVVGVDDGAFSSSKKIGERALLMAVLFKGSRIQAVRIDTIEVDGNDAAPVLQALLKRLRYDLILLSGISFAGFNLIDISKLARKLHKPIIAISREKPNNKAVKLALRGHFKDWKSRWSIVCAAGKLYSCKPLPSEPKLYFEVKGATPEYARHVITGTAFISRLPEPVRVARILAHGLSPLTGAINA
jgi:endonuclease V-like protein UPF0215 family